MPKRKPPVSHRVSQHNRDGKVVDSYRRGSGQPTQRKSKRVVKLAPTRPSPPVLKWRYDKFFLDGRWWSEKGWTFTKEQALDQMKRFLEGTSGHLVDTKVFKRREKRGSSTYDWVFAITPKLKKQKGGPRYLPGDKVVNKYDDEPQAVGEVIGVLFGGLGPYRNVKYSFVVAFGDEYEDAPTNYSVASLKKVKSGAALPSSGKVADDFYSGRISKRQVSVLIRKAEKAGRHDLSAEYREVKEKA